MIDNAAPRESHLGSAIPSQRTDDQTTGSERTGAHRLDGARANEANVTGSDGPPGYRDRHCPRDWIGEPACHRDGNRPGRPTVGRAGPCRRTEPCRSARSEKLVRRRDDGPAGIPHRPRRGSGAGRRGCGHRGDLGPHAGRRGRRGRACARSGSSAGSRRDRAATGRPAPPPKSETEPSDRLPSSERNMLIFVAMLLALGTIAVVATMGLGRFG